MRGNLNRALNVLIWCTAVCLGRRLRHRQRLDGPCRGRCACPRWMDLRLLLQAPRSPRPGQSRPAIDFVDQRCHATGGALRFHQRISVSLPSTHSGVMRAARMASARYISEMGSLNPLSTSREETRTYLAGSLDMVAHELTHGVTSSSSNLIPGDEPGALNEAFSDMMGTSVEFFFQVPGAGIGQADYLIGEDSVRSRVGGLNGFAHWSIHRCSEIPITTASSSPVPRTRVEFTPIRRSHLTRSISRSRAAGIASPVSPFKASEQPIASR